MNGLTFKFPDDETDYRIMTILTPSNIEHQYIVYTDGNEIYASRYTVKDKVVTLYDVEEEYEWNYIDKELTEAQNGV